MNRAIILTGANNGIGLAMAKGLIDLGDRVAGLDLSGENLSPLVAEFPDKIRYYPCDVTDPGHVQTAVDDAARNWGEINILINCACLALFKPYADRAPEDIRREFEVNYFGYLNLINAVLPYMRRQGKGVIHNFSSGVGITGFPGLSGYTSTKGAIEALTHTLALEFADYGITVNLMHPPLTRTKSASPLGIPLEMMADPEKVGIGLAKKVGKTNPVLTPDFISAFQMFFTYHFPIAMGRFLTSMMKRSKRTEK